MHTVVVYESMYGNSRKVAETVGDALRDAGPVEVVPVAAVGRPVRRRFRYPPGCTGTAHWSGIEVDCSQTCPA